jgi:hypothetical protein
MQRRLPPGVQKGGTYILRHFPPSPRQLGHRREVIYDPSDLAPIGAVARHRSALIYRLKQRCFAINSVSVQIVSESPKSLSNARPPAQPAPKIERRRPACWGLQVEKPE